MSQTNSNSIPPTGPRKSRWSLRFSLRGLFVAMTLCACLLAWRLQRAKQQKEAVAAIQAAGGWVHYDYQRLDMTKFQIDPQAMPWEPAWILQLVGIDFFHDVVEVNMVYNEDGPQRLDNRGPSRNIAVHLQRFPRVQSLLLHHDSVDDEGFYYVGRLRNLDTLMLWEADAITDAGAVHLRGLPRLRSLHLGNSQITDRGFEVLAALPNLERLSMQRNRITDVGAAALVRHPKLRSVWIGALDSTHRQVTDATVVHLATIPHLEELDLQHTQVTVAGLKPLQHAKMLKSLYLSGSAADDLAAATQMLPNCRLISATMKPPGNAADSTDRQ